VDRLGSVVVMEKERGSLKPGAVDAPTPTLEPRHGLLDGDSASPTSLTHTRWVCSD